MKKLKKCRFIWGWLFSMALWVGAANPVIQVIQQPSAGEELQPGSSTPIQWQTSDDGDIVFSSVSLYQYGKDRGVLEQRDQAGAVSFNWDVHAPVGSGYHLHFFALDDEDNHREIDSPTFQIGSGGSSQKPTITVLQKPAAGSVLNPGQQVTVRWEVDDDGVVDFTSVSLYQDGNYRDVLYTKDGGFTTTYDWSVDASPGSGYHLRFFARDENGSFVEVDTPTFNISSGSSGEAPEVTVLNQPSSGALLTAGESVPLAWQATDDGVMTRTTVSLYQHNDPVKVLGLGYAYGSGTFAFNWRITAAPGSGYHLRFFAVDDVGLSDDVDSPFFSIEPMELHVDGYLLGNPGQNGSATPEVGLGVNAVSGNFFHEELDATLPGMVPFVFSRAYNSLDIPFDTFGYVLNRPLGWGWTHSYNVMLRLNGAQDQAELIWGDGRRDRFEKEGGSWKAATPGNFSTLEAGGSGVAWRVITESHTEYRFDTSLDLTEIRSRTGQSLSLSYQNDRLAYVQDRANRLITFSYNDDDLLEKISVPPSRTVEFEYTRDGFLKQVTDMRGNTRQYVYYNGWLREIHRKNSSAGSVAKPALQISYDEEGRVSEQSNAHILTLGRPGDAFSWGTQTLSYISAGGPGATYQWNDYGQVTNVIPINTTASTLSYQTNAGNLAILPDHYQDALGLTYGFSYDPDSPQNLSAIQLPNEVGGDYSFDFNSNNDLSSYSTPAGLTASLVRDQFGNPTTITMGGPGIPATIETKASYVASGDFQGELKEVESGAGGKTEIVQRAADGQPLEIRRYVSAGSYLTTKYTYDNAGRVTGIEDHRGTHTYFWYDELDNVTDVLVGLTTGRTLAPASASVRHMHYEYDSEDRVIAETHGYGGDDPRTLYYQYNSHAGVLYKIEDEGGTRTTKFYYDDDLRLWRTVDQTTGREDRHYELANGRVQLEHKNQNGTQGSLSEITRREYDENGKLLNASSCTAIDQPGVSSSDCVPPDDRRINISYDDRQRVTQVLESLDLNGHNPPVQRSLSYIYTDEGRTVTRIEQDGGGIGDGAEIKQEVRYDAAGRLIQVTDFDGLTGYTTYAEYDGDGHVTKVTDPSGLETSYTYDLLGRPLSQTDLRGTVTWNYNDSSGTVTRTEPDGTTVVSSYNRLGQHSQQTTSDGNSFSFFYDDRGRLVKELWTGTGGTGERNYSYNVYGELLSVEEPFGQMVSYTYDDLGRLTQKNYAGISVGYTYDAFGSVKTMTTPLGTFQFGYQPFTHALSNIQYPNGVITTLTRNDAGELQQISSSHSGNTFLDYLITPDAVGRSKQIQSTQPTPPQFKTDQLNLEYHANGLLKELISNGDQNAIEPFNYDGRGNLTALPSPIGASFSYDVLNRVTQVDATTHRYDASRNRIETVREGETTRYLLDVEPSLPDVIAILDGNNQIQETFIYGPGGLLASIKGGAHRFVHQDFNQNVTALTDENGAVVGSFAYTPYGLSAGQNGETDFPFQFSGGVGVMTDPEGVIQMRARYYHPGIRQFTSGDLIPGTLTRPQSLGRYAYIEGRAMGGIDPSGLESRTQKYANGYYFGTGIAEQELERYVSIIRDPNAAWYQKGGAYAGGAFAALWTPTSFQDTGLSLSGGGAVRSAVARNTAKKTASIYRVPGEATSTGRSYIGRHNRSTPARTRRSNDGRDRTQAVIEDRYNPRNTLEGRIKEQQHLDRMGGVKRTDNLRNEIDPRVWNSTIGRTKLHMRSMWKNLVDIYR